MSCFGDSTGLRESRRAPLAFAPVFDRQALLLVDFTRVHITLVRPGTTPPEVALDTTVDFPSDQDSLRLPLTVSLSAGATSEPFDLTLAMLDSAGAVVFRGGPTRVIATAGMLGGQAPEIPMVYVGTGSNSAGVRFRAPVPTTVFFDSTAVFVAEAYDSAGAVLAGTPILYSVDPADTAKARVPDPAVGRVIAKPVRGPAAVVARLLTGQTARTSLLVQPRAITLAVAGGGGQTGPVGAALPQPLTVRVTAADGLGVQGILVAFAVTSGGGSLSATSGTTDSSGNASAAWTLGNTPGAQSVTATSGGLAGSPLTITATATTTSVPVASVTVSPATATLAVGATQQLTAATRDSVGATLTGRVVTWASSASGVAMVGSGGLVTAVAAGSATITATSEGVSGTATVTVLATVPVASVTVAPATATVTVGATQQLTATTRDAAGATLTGRTVTWTSSNAAVATVSGGGLVTAVAVGTDTITATSESVSGRAVVTVSAAAGVVSTTVTPQFDTLTALGATFTLVAQARDGAGAPMAGHFTWVSRNPSFVAVDTFGVVKAVANGSAYVVATEAGGTNDSALIVVQQRIASITVTPGTRSIYLTGRFTFTASAVDGAGMPIPIQPAFTWSSTASAVASVDTAGNVTALGLGTTQIRATSGAIIGVAAVNVITPITRIAVVVDTVGAVRTDTFTLTSLGFTRRYRAIAHDTLDAVMTGVSFTWASSNGSVAVANTTAGDTVSVTSAANGVTEIRATAQGFTSAPGALLTVAQVLASIELTPPAARIAPTGTVGLVARGKDANDRYISGGSFTFASATPAVATVGATTGRVTGVTIGTSDVTASSGAITSNASVITVSNEVPPVISFGRDTLSVGRGSSASIPILLSVPPEGALTVNLAVADTFAYWSTPTVTIPAGATSINATLNGRNAGTTTVTAVDGTGAGYAGASAVLAVTATMRLTSTGYAINATDIVSTQVLLSDPSPAGGTYVTFSYGTAGIAAISPDPAFVPAGGLAADIQIRGIGAGTTTITPTAVGVSGTASSFTASAAVLTISATSLRLGQGQYSPDVYVQVPTYTRTPLPVSLASSDTNVVTVPATATISVGNYYVSFTTTARATGTATISVSAPGWTAARTMAVTVTSPAVGLCCTSSLYTTSPAQNATVYAEDSAGTSHYRVNSLVVHLASRDTTVMKVLDTIVTIAPGSYYSNGRVTPGALGGATWIVATASGHAPDSVRYTVLGPPLALSPSAGRVGAGQEDYNPYVGTPNAVTAPLVVTLANTDSSLVGAPPSVTILTGTNYTYFTVRGKTPGPAVTLTASAPGYQSASATYTVTPPRLAVYGYGTIDNFGAGGGITIYTTDSAGSSHYRSSPLTVSIMSTDTTITKVDSATVRIDSGTYYNNRARFMPVGLGTARIIVSAAGHTVLDTLTVTVVQPRIRFSTRSIVLGRRQYYQPSSFYVYTPNYRASALAVTITQLHSAVDSLAATALTIPAGGNSSYFGGVYGLALGMDTLVVTAPGYLPDTAFVTVSTPRFVSSGIPSSATTTSSPIGLSVYAMDSVGNSHYAMDTVVVHAVSSDSTVIRPAQPYIRLLKGWYYVGTAVNVVGPGAASITYSDSAGTGYLPVTTGTITITGPSLSLYNSTQILGMRQTGGANAAYVSTPNNVTSPLVVRLLSTGTRVVTVPDSVIVQTGANFAYFTVTAMDTVGTIQVQATALGYNAASMNVQVTEPRFYMSTSSPLNTTTARQTIYIYAADANGTTHYTTENVAVTLLSSSPSVASIDSTTVTLLAGSSYNATAHWSPGQVGTAQLSASDPRTAIYHYNTVTDTVTVVQPSITFSWGGVLELGIGQYDSRYVYAPDNQAAPLSVALAHSATPRTSITVGGTAVTGVTIPSGTNSASFHVVGTSAGNDTLIATATSPAHNPDTAYVLVAPGRVDPLSGWPTSIRVADSVLVTLYSRDAATSSHYVAAATTFTLAPNANIQFVSQYVAGGPASAVITSVTIPADAYYVQFYLKGVSAGTGSVTITQANYQTYTPTVTVSP